MARKYILDKNGSGTILARKYFLDAGRTEPRDDQPKAGRGWETAISGATEFIWTRLYETFFLQLLFTIIFFQFMTQRAKSARASSAARMRSTPSAGRVYTVTIFHTHWNLINDDCNISSFQCCCFYKKTFIHCIYLCRGLSSQQSRDTSKVIQKRHMSSN